MFVKDISGAGDLLSFWKRMIWGMKILGYWEYFPKLEGYLVISFKLVREKRTQSQ